MTTKELAKMIRFQMKAKGFTQDLLARKVGISRIILNRFLNGKSNLRLDAVLGVMQVLEIEIQEPPLMKDWKKNLGPHFIKDI